jgi:hypothetical protein
MKYLSAGDVARRLGRSIESVRNYRRSGKLVPAFIISKNFPAYSEADVIAFAATLRPERGRG